MTAQGRVSAFGDAPMLGSLTAAGPPVVGIAATPSGEGCWLVNQHGDVQAAGDPAALGDAGLARPVIGLAATASGAGYWALNARGTTTTYASDELGNCGQ